MTEDEILAAAERIKFQRKNPGATIFEANAILQYTRTGSLERLPVGATLPMTVILSGTDCRFEISGTVEFEVPRDADRLWLEVVDRDGGRQIYLGLLLNLITFTGPLLPGGTVRIAPL